MRDERKKKGKTNYSRLERFELGICTGASPPLDGAARASFALWLRVIYSRQRAPKKRRAALLLRRCRAAEKRRRAHVGAKRARVSVTCVVGCGTLSSRRECRRRRLSALEKET